MYEVRQEQYTTVIREMTRHENDVTNHRIMWLLIGQGFIANAYVSADHRFSRKLFATQDHCCPRYLKRHNEAA